MIQKVILASGNQGKLLELQETLKGLPCELTPQPNTPKYDVEETGTTFVENAIIKARNASLLSGVPAIADDSGLIIDALGGEPGVKTARYAGPRCSSQENMDLVLSRLIHYKESQQRRATFICVLVYLRCATDPLPIIVTGQWSGAIAQKQHGKGGFGYDPIFWDFTQQMTSAQMSKQQKAKLSHRGQACEKLKIELQSLWGK